MVLELRYNNKWDTLEKSELPEAYYGALALSCALDVVSGVSNHIEIIQKIVNNYPERTNRDIWYLTVLSFLKIRTKDQKSYYANKLVSDLYVKYCNMEFPEDMVDMVNQINIVIPYEGLFISLYDGVNEEDLILNTIVSIKDDLRTSCEKYFVFKNVAKDFIEKTISAKNIDSKYINEFDLLFDVFIMFMIQTLEDVFMDGVQYNEMEVRSYIFAATERFVDGIFLKNTSKIKNSICSLLAKKELALKGEMSESQ